MDCYCVCHSSVSSCPACEHCYGSGFDGSINCWNETQLRSEVIRLRKAIRIHRDQRLDDRCWMDDYQLYEILPEGIDPSFVDLRLLSKEVMKKNCDRFIECRTISLTPDEAMTKYKAKREK